MDVLICQPHYTTQLICHHLCLFHHPMSFKLPTKPQSSVHGNDPCYKHEVGGVVSHGTITRGDNCAHPHSIVDPKYPTPAKVLSMFLVFAMSQPWARFSIEQLHPVFLTSPTMEFRALTNGRGTASRSALPVTVRLLSRTLFTILFLTDLSSHSHTHLFLSPYSSLTNKQAPNAIGFTAPSTTRVDYWSRLPLKSKFSPSSSPIATPTASSNSKMFSIPLSYHVHKTSSTY